MMNKKKLKICNRCCKHPILTQNKIKKFSLQREVIVNELKDIDIGNEKYEYDFTNAEQGKFYRPIEELDIPRLLDKEAEHKNIQKQD